MRIHLWMCDFTLIWASVVTVAYCYIMPDVILSYLLQVEILYIFSLKQVSFYTLMFCVCFHSCRVPVQMCESLHVPASLGWYSRVRPSQASSRGMLWGALGPCCWTAAWLWGRLPPGHSGESTVYCDVLWTPPTGCLNQTRTPFFQVSRCFWEGGPPCRRRFVATKLHAAPGRDF